MPQINPSEIGNKIKRQQVFQRQLQRKAADDKERKRIRRKEERANPELGEARRRANVPKTLENTREFDETMVVIEEPGVVATGEGMDGAEGGDGAVQEPDEVLRDEAEDEFAAYFTGAAPKVLITTSKSPNKVTYHFAEELLSVFPNSTFVKRGLQFEIADIVKFCTARGFSDLIIINEDRKKANAMIFVHLPDGPTCYFKLTSVRMARDMKFVAAPTPHFPELILNNFNTRLGRIVGRHLNSLFPQQPQFKGRQVATMHNQRDFIFFRRHRYVFASKDQAQLRELGPRFTLKLKWLQKGTFDRKNGEYEWIHRPEMDTSRRRFFL